VLYPNELVIHDGNVHQHKHATILGPDGVPMAKGLILRLYSAHPLGCYSGILPYTAVEFPLIPRDQWPERIREQIAKKRRNSDIRARGNNGQPIPSRDQNGRGYCWQHSGVSAMLGTRACMNLPYADLSAYACACRDKNFRDEGGWGAAGVDNLIKWGVPTSAKWPQKATDRALDNPATWEEAAFYKVTEGWIDLAANQYDRQLSFDQRASLWLVNGWTVDDYNWWSHSVCGADLVDGNSQFAITRAESGKLMEVAEFETFWGINNPVTAGYGVRLWNSWGENWSAQGMGTLTGNQAQADGGVGLLIVTAA
jgi:hypothetical protein